MRQTFISLLDKLVILIVALILIGAFFAGIFAMFQGGGFFAGIGIWIGGAVYAVLVGGMLFLFLGIHENTKRTAEAVEKLANRPAS